MRSALVTLALAALATAAAPARAQSKPEVGSQATPFKVFGVTGQFDGKEVELAARPAEHRQLFLFVAADTWDRPTGRYLKKLDDALLKGIEGVDAIDVYAIWLTATPQDAKDYLPKAQQSMRLGQTSLAVFEGPEQGPDGWGLDPEAYLTAVLVQNGKVTASFAYRSTNDTNVPALVETIRK